MAERLVHIDGYKKEIKTVDIVARYLSGESMWAISKDTGVSVPTLRYRLRKSGIDTSRRAGEGDNTVETVADAVKSLYSSMSTEDKASFRNALSSILG